MPSTQVIGFQALNPTPQPLELGVGFRRQGFQPLKPYALCPQTLPPPSPTPLTLQAAVAGNPTNPTPFTLHVAGNATNPPHLTLHVAGNPTNPTPQNPTPLTLHVAGNPTPPHTHTSCGREPYKPYPPHTPHTHIM